MIEIIPNWHPIFVHFTVGVFSVAFVLYIFAYLFNHLKLIPAHIVTEFEITGRWCLWIAGIMTIFTVMAGLYAYNTVRHDEPSHLAMINHRNWALPTAGLIVLFAIWSAWRHYKNKTLSFAFIISLFIVEILLICTAWRGGELVYRHGLGVMSLPKAEGGGHNHPHGEKTKDNNIPSMEPQEQHNHAE